MGSAEKSTGDLLFVIADDLTPCEQWDTLLETVVRIEQG